MGSFQIYLLFSLLPKIGIVLSVLGWFTVIATVICVFGTDKEEKKERLHLCRQTIWGVILVIIAFFIPSQKEIAIIYLAPKIINNQTVQQIPAEIMKFIDKQIESDEVGK